MSKRNILKRRSNNINRQSNSNKSLPHMLTGLELILSGLHMLLWTVGYMTQFKAHPTNDNIWLRWYLYEIHNFHSLEEWSNNCKLRASSISERYIQMSMNGFFQFYGYFLCWEGSTSCRSDVFLKLLNKLKEKWLQMYNIGSSLALNIKFCHQRICSHVFRVGVCTKNWYVKKSKVLTSAVENVHNKIIQAYEYDFRLL